jgi:hypothetical protein
VCSCGVGSWSSCKDGSHNGGQGWWWWWWWWCVCVCVCACACACVCVCVCVRARACASHSPLVEHGLSWAVLALLVVRALVLVSVLAVLPFALRANSGRPPSSRQLLNVLRLLLGQRSLDRLHHVDVNLDERVRGSLACCCDRGGCLGGRHGSDSPVCFKPEELEARAVTTHGVHVSGTSLASECVVKSTTDVVLHKGHAYVR